MFSKINKIRFKIEKNSEGKFDYDLFLLSIFGYLGVLVGFLHLFSGKCELWTFLWSKYFLISKKLIQKKKILFKLFSCFWWEVSELEARLTDILHIERIKLLTE
jgi:hypothetical protein